MSNEDKLVTVISYIQSKGWRYCVSKDESHIAVSSPNLTYCHAIDRAYDLYTGVIVVPYRPSRSSNAY